MGPVLDERIERMHSLARTMCDTFEERLIALASLEQRAWRADLEVRQPLTLPFLSFPSLPLPYIAFIAGLEVRQSVALHYITSHYICVADLEVRALVIGSTACIALRVARHAAPPPPPRLGRAVRPGRCPTTTADDMVARGSSSWPRRGAARVAVNVSSRVSDGVDPPPLHVCRGVCSFVPPLVRRATRRMESPSARRSSWSRSRSSLPTSR